MSEVVRLRAMAKVNLFLRVTGVLEGGFHELETLFQSVDLADVVELSPAEPGVLEVVIDAPDSLRPYLPTPQTDLVRTAASRLLQLSRQPVGASIRVVKSIPIGGGMAGGSADAAAAIVGLNALWDLGLPREVLLDIAAELGSDVPFCIEGGTAFATSRGTELTRLEEPSPIWFVLGISDRPLMTSAVYDAWDRVGQTGAASPEAMIEALRGGDPAAIGARFHNDLYGPALSLRPEIERGIATLLEAGALGAAMSGSGPTVFGIAGGESEAADIARTVTEHFFRVEVSRSSPVGVLPG
jgi:4-diphosphocytidyl-2-C-methyl-D-erythritol kinase